MPIPMRSHSLRQPGFSQIQSGGLKANTSDKEVNSADKGAKTLGPNHDTKKGLDNDNDHASKTAHSHTMSLPTQLKRASSLRQPSRQAQAASIGTTHPLRNTSDENKTRTHDGSLLQPYPVSTEVHVSTRRSQPTDQLRMTQIPAAQNVAKGRSSLHSRAWSVGGPITLQGNPRDNVDTNSRDVSAPSWRKPSPQSLSASDHGQNPQRIKPQFSTYQQHYSPKKPPKALAPPISGRSNDQQHASITASGITTTYTGAGDDTNNPQTQISRLQDELLQLQMIRNSSHSQQKIYLENTMQKFKDQFTGLSGDNRALAAHERGGHTAINCAAFQRWLSEGKLSTTEKIQALSECLQDIAALTAPDGKLCLAIGQFEQWFEKMVLISNSRGSGTTGFEAQETLISPLGQEWHDQVAVLHRKLDHCTRVLNDLGSAREGSGLAIVLDAHKLFLDNFRQELECFSAIERSTIQQEQTWITESIANIMQEDNSAVVASHKDDLRRGAWNVDMA